MSSTWAPISRQQTPLLRYLSKTTVKHVLTHFSSPNKYKNSSTTPSFSPNSINQNERGIHRWPNRDGFRERFAGIREVGEREIQNARRRRQRRAVARRAPEALRQAVVDGIRASIVGGDYQSLRRPVREVRRRSERDDRSAGIPSADEGDHARQGAWDRKLPRLHYSTGG